MPSFLASTFAIRLLGDRRILLATPIIVLLLVGGTGRTASEDAPVFTPTWYMVIDWANLLDEGQEQSAINDAWRLSMLGVPTQVVTELAQSTPELARQRADQLRIDHGIESGPGADDGILIYAAVNPSDRSLVTMAVSVGTHALPHGGLDDASIDEIVSSIMVPQLTSGQPARAIVYSIREMIYFELFTPPPTTSLDGWRANLHSILPWAAPLIAVVTAGVTARGIDNLTSIGAAAKRILPTLCMSLALGILAIAGRSAPGAFAAIGLLVAAVILAILADRSIRRNDHRPIVVSPRPPGRFSSRGVRA